MASSQELLNRVQHSNISQPISFATVKPYPNFDAREDANSLDKAIQAKGVDEHIIISMLANRTNMQRQQIADAYKKDFGKDLSQSLKNVLSGKLKDVTLSLLQPPTLFDTHALKNTMKGLGTDEESLVEILATRTNQEKKDITDTYQTGHCGTFNVYQQPMLEDRTPGVIFHPTEPPGGYVYSLGQELNLNKTTPLTRHLPTPEVHVKVEFVPVRILLNYNRPYSSVASKTFFFEERQIILEFKSTVADDIASDCSGELKKLSLALAKTSRSEKQTLDYKQIDEDAKIIYNDGVKRKDADVDKFIAILAGRSNRHLERVFEKYTTLCSKGLVHSLEQDTKGEVCRAYVGLVKAIQNTPAFFAERLHQAIEGKKDDNLLRILVSRSEKDLLAIRTQYKKKYKVSLYSSIADKTKGDFKNIMLALCGQDDL